MNIKRAIIAATIVWILGVTAYTVSFFIPVLDDPELQANLVLLIALIPCAILGARFYYKAAPTTNGFRLGLVMFSVAMLLDALITVPLFMLPKGIDHLAFFTDPGFWLIALVYVGTVGIYGRLTRVQTA